MEGKFTIATLSKKLIKASVFVLIILATIALALKPTAQTVEAAPESPSTPVAPAGIHSQSQIDQDTTANTSDMIPSDLAVNELTLKMRNLYVPMAMQRYQPFTRQGPVLLGIYAQGWPGQQSTMDNEFHALDDWAGKRLSIAGTFINIEDVNPDANVRGQLTTIWKNGYTPFVNLDTKGSAFDIASGSLDSQLRVWAKAYAAYAKGGERSAFIAPLQEMNGYWVSYGLNPTNFKLAYQRIQDIFAQEGVPDKSVKWVFAPNGWSRPQDAPFEDYYPGDKRVDVVSFSGYNFGFAPGMRGAEWQPPDEVFGEYILRFQRLAPTKPLFIAQTGTTPYYYNGISNDAKNEWIREAYDYLANFNNVRAVIYFNLINDQGYLWPFYQPNGARYEGYRDAVKDSDFEYLSPVEVKQGF